MDPMFFNSGEVVWKHPCTSPNVSPPIEDERLHLLRSSVLQRLACPVSAASPHVTAQLLAQALKPPMAIARQTSQLQKSLVAVVTVP